MTAKEKVLAANPGAVVCEQAGTTWIADSAAKWVKLSAVISAEDVAWQNAAESLPAAPEQNKDDDDGKCGLSDSHSNFYCTEDKGHTSKHKALTPNGYHCWPVAPVETNEKEPDDIGRECLITRDTHRLLTETSEDFADRMRRQLIQERRVKPQPDSSSISTEQDGYVQLMREIKGEHDRLSPYTQCACWMCIRITELLAAKGQSNGR